MMYQDIPLIGLCAFSGSGKTTLMTSLIPLLKAADLNIAVVKHAHHEFDVDVPGKDSYEIRKSGADQVLVAARHRIALVKEFADNKHEPKLDDALQCIDTRSLDLILVEGFKFERFPKIEICRPELEKPRLYKRDPDVIAVASDQPLSDLPARTTHLELNQPRDIAEFILGYMSEQLNRQTPQLVSS